MDGLDCLGAFDYMSLVKGAGGLLSGFGGGTSQPGQPTAQQMMEQQRLREAEQSASTMKMILIALVALVGAGGIALAVGGRK